ncbi:MAG: O-antigen ligase family protein [Actinobacteria bacterium]|nr:O-antigen ligase family protein [Actinomycetota bacterium]
MRDNTLNNYEINILKKSFIYLLIFVVSYVVFFEYQKYIISENIYLIVIVNTLILVIFLLAVFKTKSALFLFIFLIPLLNSLNRIIPSKDVDVILFLFFPLWLGFIVNGISEALGKNYLKKRNIFIFDKEFSTPIVLLISVMFISAAVAIFRYSNFYPFITNKFYNLVVNLNGFTSIVSIYWVLKLFFNFLCGFLFFYLIYNVIKSNKDIITSLLILVASTIVSSFVLFYQYFFNPYFGNSEVWANSGRLNATFTDPNSLGNYTVLLFPVFLIFIFYFKKWYQKTFFGIFFMVLVLMIFLSGSRSAFMGSILSTFVLIIISFTEIKKWFRKRKKLAFIFIIFVSVLFVVFVLILSKKIPFVGEIGLFNKLSESITAVLSYYRKDGFIEAIKAISNYRYIYWQQAVWMFKDYPVAGIGLGTYITELPQYIIKTGANFFQIDFAGNYYLQILAELGVTGFVLVGFIFYLVIKKGYKIIKKGKDKLLPSALLTSFISMLVVFNLGAHTNIIEVQFTFWLIIGLLITFTNINKLKNNNSYSIQNKNISVKISFIIIIIIFAVNLLISSFGELSTNIKQVIYGWENKYGFYQEINIDGEECRLTSIDASEVLEKKGSKITLPIKALNPDIKSNPLYVKIYINNYLIKTIKFDDYKWHDVIIDLRNIERNKFTLTIVCSRSWIPTEWGFSLSKKELGILIGKEKFIK